MTGRQQPPRLLAARVGRRRFLGLAGGGLAGLALAGVLPAQGMAAAEEEPFAFAVVADSHIDPFVPVRSQRLAQIYGELARAETPAPAFVFHVGDIVETGLPDQYAEYDRLVPRELGRRLYHIPGNHEVRWDEWGKEGYTARFGPTPYSFDRGGIHFIALDPTQLLQEPGYFSDEQLRWLDADLRKVARGWPSVIFVHYPMGAAYYYVSNQDAFFRTIAPYNVRAVIAGHIHNEEIARQNGLTLVNLEAVRDAPVYYWVEKRRAADGAPVLAIDRALFAAGAAAATRTPYVEVPLTGDGLGRAERPERIDFTPPAAGATTAALAVTVGPAARVQAVRYRFWPEYTYGGRDSAAWTELAASAAEPRRWEAAVDTSGRAPGAYRLQIRVVNPDGAHWDEALPVALPDAAGQPRVLWQVEAPGEAQAGLVTAPRPAGAPALVVAASTAGVVTALPGEGRPGRPVWQARLGGGAIGTPAVSGDGALVFVGATDRRVYALDAASGAVAWSHETARAVLGSLLWTGDGAPGGLVLAPTGRSIVALEAATGRMVWTAGAGGFIGGRPAADAGAVYAGAGDGKAYAFDLASGAARWQSTIVTRPTPHSTLLNSPWATAATLLPAAPGGPPLVLVATVGGIFALDRATGAQVWKKTGGRGFGYMYSPPLYLAGPQPALILADEWGWAVAADPATGADRWRTLLDQRIFNTAPVLAGGLLYFTGVNGLLAGLDPATGAVARKLHFGTNYTYSSPTLAGGLLFAGGQDGVIRAIALDEESHV